MTDISPWFWLSLLGLMIALQAFTLWEMENETKGSNK